MTASFDIDLLDGASDVDNGAVLTIANLSGLTPGLTLEGSVLRVDPSDAAFQSLQGGEMRVITVTYDVVDENNLSTP